MCKMADPFSEQLDRTRSQFSKVAALENVLFFASAETHLHIIPETANPPPASRLVAAEEPLPHSEQRHALWRGPKRDGQ